MCNPQVFTDLGDFFRAHALSPSWRSAASAILPRPLLAPESALSFVLTVWQMPTGATPPSDVATADALLAQQQDAPERPDPVFLRFGEALYERFPAGLDDPSPSDAWLDGSESGEDSGPTLNFGLNTRGDHFEAAYMHAVAQANRLGLNLHDGQTGEHHLADGRRLPDGDHPIGVLEAEAAWRKSDWTASIAAWRRGVESGVPEAIHDLGRALQEGLGLPRHLMLAGALMQIAAPPDDARRRQRLAALKAWPAGLRDRQAAVRDRLRAAPALLPAIDAELAAEAKRRQPIPMLTWKTSTYDDATWFLLRELAADGDDGAARRLANAHGPVEALRGRPPWTVGPGDYADWLRLSSDRGDGESSRDVISGLLSGRDGWPMDPPEALHRLRREAANGARWAVKPAERLGRRLLRGWNPVADRPRAEEVLREALRADGGQRLALLRQACELDHPDAWRALGTAYLRGDLGLPQDEIIGGGLHLFAQKDLSSYSSELGLACPAALAALSSHRIDDALQVSRELVGAEQPWEVIGRMQRFFDENPPIVVSLGQDMRSRAVIDDSRTRGTAPSPAAPARTTRRSPEQETEPRHQGGSGLVLLAIGTLGPLLLLALTQSFGRTGTRIGLIVTVACALMGVWRCGARLDWSPLKRAGVGVLAAMPGVGLFAAAAVLRAVMQWSRANAD